MRFATFQLFLILFIFSSCNSTLPDPEQPRTERLPLTQAEKSILNSKANGAVTITKIGEMRFRHKHLKPGNEDDSLHPDLYAWEP